MPLARDSRDTIRARIERNPSFREELLKEGAECLLSGDVDIGKEVLRDYISATIDFQELGGSRGASPQSADRSEEGATAVRAGAQELACQ